ncbi:MAG TPA: hypothetical protein VNI84_04430, partial [Pyrinomonadaceae bacterium]|nr:hypothetical protein [Pyrinomonadaceae bacterium]
SLKVQSPKSKIVGFVPSGNYPSAVAVVGNRLFIGNGKGTGVENSSVIVNNSGRFPNMPNELFPAGRSNLRGQYNPPLEGAALGAAIWAIGYLGWLPAVGLLPPITEQKPMQIFSPVWQHALYGIVTVTVYRRLENSAS